VARRARPVVVLYVSFCSDFIDTMRSLSAGRPSPRRGILVFRFAAPAVRQGDRGDDRTSTTAAISNG
jgi:hypothetical protein